MGEALHWAMIATGITGLVGFAAGALVADVPRVDRQTEDVLDTLTRRRTQLLAGSILSITGSTLLLWPIAAVATIESTASWRSLALFSVLAWVIGFGLLAIASLLCAALVWRDPRAFDTSIIRVLLDGIHLATWSISAPIGAISVVATTVVGSHAGIFGSLVIAMAVAKVATVMVELVGTGRRAGWNAGGWAGGSSGYVTVAWFVCVLVALA